MPLPLAPIAVVALRYGTVALAAYAVTRRIERAERRQNAEDTLDQIDEGLALRRATGPMQFNAQGRWCRSIRLGRTGPDIEIDATALGRVKFRKIT